MSIAPMIAPGEALLLQSLVTSTVPKVASRVLARNHGGILTVFAFDAGQRLPEHTSPFEALVIVLEGLLIITMGGPPVRAESGTIVRIPADVPHAVHAPEPARMLLVLLRGEADGHISIPPGRS
jgi:quercetin dioxygenase-like cupin family protein